MTCTRGNRPSSSGVRSVEPSSTTRTSSAWRSTSARTGSRWASSLYTGIAVSRRMGRLYPGRSWRIHHADTRRGHSRRGRGEVNVGGFAAENAEKRTHHGEHGEHGEQKVRKFKLYGFFKFFSFLLRALRALRGESFLPDP